MKKIKLSDYIFSIGDGLHGTPSFDKNGDYYFINGNNLSNGCLDLTSATKISKAEYTKISRPLTSNCILYSINGTIGNIAYYNGEKIALGKSACYINVKTNVNKYFIGYILTSKEFIKYAYNVAHGSTIKNLAPSQIMDYEFEVSDDFDENKFGTFYKEFFNENYYNNASIKELLSISNIIFNYWFNQFEFPNNSGKPYKSSGGAFKYVDELNKEIPLSFEYKTISDIENNIITGKTPSTKNKDNFGNEIPFITIDDIRDNVFITKTKRSLSLKGSESQNNKYIPKNSLCVTCIGTPGLIGITTTKSQTNQQINSIVFNHDYNLLYFYFYLKNYFNYSNNVKVGNIFSNMNKDDFSKIKILYNEEVIKKFYNETIDIFKQIENISLHVSKLNEIQNHIFPLIMAGKVKI